MENDKIVGIHQPNFMPWLGYFYKIWQSDVFVFLDDVQIIKTGSSYTNRVEINNNGKRTYLTVPIKKSKDFSLINETRIINNGWKKKALKTLQQNYSKADFFNSYKDFIFELISFENDNLSEYNIHFITAVSQKLDFDTNLVKSSDFKIEAKSTERLIELVKKVEGKVYLSGSGGDKYQEKEMFDKNGIKLIYNKLPEFQYKQIKTDEFIPGLSIIDAIFNIGFEGLKNELFIKNEKDKL